MDMPAQAVHEGGGPFDIRSFSPHEERHRSLDGALDPSRDRGVEIGDPPGPQPLGDLDSRLCRAGGRVEDEEPGFGALRDPPAAEKNLLDLRVEGEGEDDKVAGRGHLRRGCHDLCPLRFQRSRFFRVPCEDGEGVPRLQDVCGHGFSHGPDSDNAYFHGCHSSLLVFPGPLSVSSSWSESSPAPAPRWSGCGTPSPGAPRSGTAVSSRP